MYIIIIILIAITTFLQGVAVFLSNVLMGNIIQTLAGDFYLYLCAIGFLSGIIFFIMIIVNAFDRTIIHSGIIGYHAYFTLGLALACLIGYFVHKL